jgi:hypothetical protein
MSNYCLIKNKNNEPDINTYGSVDYNFFIQQNFISCENYVEFLNCISPLVEPLGLYNQYTKNIIQSQQSIFSLNPDVDPYSPIKYININNLKIYCNWINTHNLKIINEFPYNIKENTFEKSAAKYWIPNFNEWYKAVYYDAYEKKYWAFPNSSDSYSDSDMYNNTMTKYGLINAGFKYFTIIDNSYADKYTISGGSNNRHPNNAKSGIKYEVSNEYYANYISARICKKSETKQFTVKLYDTYGDGWKDNYIDINDSLHNPIISNITLDHGYGPYTKIINIDLAEKNFNIRYHSKNKLSYENYYEIYDCDNKLIFKSTMYEKPPDNTIIKL